MNCMKVSYEIEVREGYSVHSSQDIYEAMKPLFNPIQEILYLLPMTATNEMTVETLFIGGLTAANTDNKTIFHTLLTKYPNCPAFVIAHNHPSGNNSPSDNDDIITNRLKEASLLIGLDMLDHIIFSNTGYYSYADHDKLHHPRNGET